MALDHLSPLRDKIDICLSPFSDRGPRLLVYKRPEETCLYVKLAERLTHLDPGPVAGGWQRERAGFAGNC